MATLIMYLVLAIGGMATIWGVVHVHDGKVKTAALAPWEPLTKECNNAKLEPAQCADQWRTLMTANVQIQSDFERLKSERQACTDSVTKLGKDTQAALAAKDEKLAIANKKILDLKASQDALEAALEQPPVVGETCEATLAKINDHNDAIGARRLRDYGPAGVDQSGKPAAAKGSGNDSLHITN